MGWRKQKGSKKISSTNKREPPQSGERAGKEKYHKQGRKRGLRVSHSGYQAPHPRRTARGSSGSP